MSTIETTFDIGKGKKLIYRESLVDILVTSIGPVSCQSGTATSEVTIEEGCLDSESSKDQQTITTLFKVPGIALGSKQVEVEEKIKQLSFKRTTTKTWSLNPTNCIELRHDIYQTIRHIDVQLTYPKYFPRKPKHYHFIDKSSAPHIVVSQKVVNPRCEKRCDRTSSSECEDLGSLFRHFVSFVGSKSKSRLTIPVRLTDVGTVEVGRRTKFDVDRYVRRNEVSMDNGPLNRVDLFENMVALCDALFPIVLNRPNGLIFLSYPIVSPLSTVEYMRRTIAETSKDKWTGESLGFHFGGFANEFLGFLKILHLPSKRIEDLQGMDVSISYEEVEQYATKPMKELLSYLFDTDEILNCSLSETPLGTNLSPFDGSISNESKRKSLPNEKKFAL